MRQVFKFHGRKAGAIGIFHVIPETFIGESGTIGQCLEDARKRAYAAGWEHLSFIEAISETGEVLERKQLSLRDL